MKFFFAIVAILLQCADAQSNTLNICVNLLSDSNISFGIREKILRAYSTILFEKASGAVTSEDLLMMFEASKTDPTKLFELPENGGAERGMIRQGLRKIHQAMPISSADRENIVQDLRKALQVRLGNNVSEEKSIRRTLDKRATAEIMRIVKNFRISSAPSHHEKDRVFAVDKNGLLKILNPSNQLEIVEHLIPNLEPTATFLADGKYFILDRGFLKIFETLTGTQVGALKNSTNASVIASDKNAEKVVFSTENGTYLWEKSTNKVRYIDKPMHTGMFVGNSKFIGVGTPGLRAEIYLIDMKSLNRLDYGMFDQGKAVEHLISPDGSIVVMIADTFEFFSIGKLIKPTGDLNEAISPFPQPMAFSPDSNLFATPVYGTGKTNRRVHLFDTRTTIKRVLNLPDLSHSIKELLPIPAKNVLVVIDEKSVLSIFHLETGELLATVSGFRLGARPIFVADHYLVAQRENGLAVIDLDLVR